MKKRQRLKISIPSLQNLFEDEDLINQKFQFIKLMGQGSFGVVVQAKQNDEKEVAIKIINKTKVPQEKLQKLKLEANILQKLQHKNIVQFLELIETSTYMLIIMELVRAGTLTQFIEAQKEITDLQASQIMFYVLNAVLYFHNNKIIHRDLKPDNILIDDQNDLSSIKIGDFGLSQQFQSNNKKWFTATCGTVIYMAPELQKNQQYSKPIDL